MYKSTCWLVNCMFAHAFITYLLWWYLKIFNIIIIYLIICEKSILKKGINLHRMFEYEDQLGHMHRCMVIWKIFLQIYFELIFSITWSHKWLMKSAAVRYFMCELCRWNFCRRYAQSQSITSIWRILIISLALISWMTSAKLFYLFEKYCSF